MWCHYLVDKDVTSDGDIHVGNFFALAQWSEQLVTGLWWSPYGEDKADFRGQITGGRLLGDLAVEHVEGGTFETVSLNEAWQGSGAKATMTGYKAVSASAFHTYVAGTGFLFSPCM